MNGTGMSGSEGERERDQSVVVQGACPVSVRPLSCDVWEMEGVMIDGCDGRW